MASHPTPIKIEERMREVEAQLRALCSPTCEGMSDYQRINKFIRVGNEAAVLLSELRRDL